MNLFRKTRLVNPLLFIAMMFYYMPGKSQTSKDNAPEVFKFDAIGTRDLVNLPTGDFNYSVPVLNVPGPEGGYSVRLTYSSGIGMDQEASWVGLGWSCSPGAIVRTVNGTPDDVKEYEAMSINQDYGVATYPDVHSFDFFDLFNRVHVQWTVSASGVREINWNNSGAITGFSYNAQTNTIPSSNIISLGLAIQEGLNRATANYGQSVGAGDNGGNVGYLTSKTINNVQVSQMGGELSYSQDGGGQNTLFYDIGHVSDLHYEAYSNFSKYSGGAFYLGNGFEADATESWRQTYNRTMDMYTNQTAYDQNVIGTNNLSFPAYDEYSVSADGLSGVLSPITMRDAPIYGSGETEGNTYSQYLIESSDPATQYTSNASFETTNQNKLSFLFRGEHASARNTPGNFTISGSTVTSTPGSLTTSGGYCTGNNKIIGGKNVKTILDGNGLITGFSITNEQGVTYNFTFPVYQYERIQSSIDSRYQNASNIKIMQKKYAYAWLLESITGADYVDKGSAGIDLQDQGYWVKFNYGKWTDGFMWSSPYDSKKEAKTIIDDDKLKTVTTNEMGMKELAYLNTVETRTHIAYFAKFVREDGLGSDMEFDKTISLTQAKEIKGNEDFYAYTLQYESNDDINYHPSDWVPPSSSYGKCFTSEIHDKLDADGNKIPSGSTDPITGAIIYKQEVTWSKYYDEHFLPGSKFIADQNSATQIKFVNHVDASSTMDKKQRVLGLKKIILVNRVNDILSCPPAADHSHTLGVDANDDASVTISTSILNPKVYGNNIFNKNNTTIPCSSSTTITSLIGQPSYLSGSRKKYYEANVIDVADIANSTIESKALQVVELNYDYSLCENAPNSLPLTTGASTNKGRLTLKSIDIKDVGGNKIAPSNNFTYALNPSYEQVNTGTTANPEWLKMEDDWGFRIATNSNLGNVVNKDVYTKDLAAAWSLTQIETPTGGKLKINYESDSYTKEAATVKNYNAQITSFEIDNSTDCRNTMTFPLQLGFGSTPTFVVGSSYNIHLTPVHLISCPTCSSVYPTLTGTFLSSASAGGTMYAKFEITSGWNTDYDYSFLYSSYVTDETNINRTFDVLTKRSECNSIKVKYDAGIDIATAFLVGNNYTINLYGTNFTSWIGSMYNATTPLVINNATVQSLNSATNEVVFSISDYDLNLTTTLTPDTYSYSTAESNGRQFFGGGIRVASLIMEDENGNQYKTAYEYKNGVTSFAPGNIWRKNIKYIAELPSPGVIYGKVIEKNVGVNNEINSVTEYEYETMNSNVEGQDLAYGDQLYIEDGQIQTATYTSGTDHQTYHTRVGTIHNNTGRIGRVNKITHENSQGLVLSIEKYNYSPKEYALSGLVQESFHERKRKTLAVWPNYYSDLYYTYSSRIFYPTELASIETQKSNISTMAKYGNSTFANNGFDIYTHKPLITENVKASGEILRSKSVLAYTKYSDMSSKTCTSSNKNMLGVVAEQIDYTVNDAGVEKVLGASSKTFSKIWNYRQFNSSSNIYENVSQTGIYMQDKTYTWKSLLDVDGGIASFTDFDWLSTATNDGWQNTSSSQLFNHYSKGLEVKDINNKSSSTKLGYNNSYVIAAGTNVKYGSFAFSGAEDVADANYFGSEVLGADKRYLSASLSHTGNYCVKLNAGETGFSFSGSAGTTGAEDFKIGQVIRTNVWLHKLNALNGRLEYTVYASDGTTVVASGYVDKTSASTRMVGTNWYLLTLDLTIPSGAAKVVFKTTNSGSSSVYFDDFKVYPTESAVTGSVYDEKTGWISATLDADDFATKYYYDSAGRILRVDKETLQGWKKVSENTYHFGRP